MTWQPKPPNSGFHKEAEYARVCSKVTSLRALSILKAFCCERIEIHGVLQDG